MGIINIELSVCIAYTVDVKLFLIRIGGFWTIVPAIGGPIAVCICQVITSGTDIAAIDHAKDPRKRLWKTSVVPTSSRWGGLLVQKLQIALAVSTGVLLFLC